MPTGESDENGTIVSEIDPMDSVEVSLLTCSPHEEIYSLYGHSAIRWHDLRSDGPVETRDIVFNWGMFNFNKPHFVLRFVFGLTDYELGVFPYSSFWPYYKKWGSSVTEQVLNLTNDEKRSLQQALAMNLRPENKVYRYNFFYDNCSTRPRDILERSIHGTVNYQDRDDYTPSYRDMVHECVRNHPWAAFGNDMLLGVKADLQTSRTEQEFLPSNLRHDFANAQIYSNGTYRPLVKEERLSVPPGVQIIESDFPLSPTECATILLIISVCILLLEIRRKKTYKFWDVVLMALQGLAGEGVTNQARTNRRVMNNFPDIRAKACDLLGEVPSEEAKTTLMVIAQDDNEATTAEAVSSRTEVIDSSYFPSPRRSRMS